MPKKKLFHTVFIACEGENTEPNYLGRMAEEIDEERQLSVTIYPKPKFIENNSGEVVSRRSDPVGLVEEARRRLSEGFDEAWAVFDKDGHSGHANAFQLANEVVEGKVVNIAFTSIAFEHWILLHFEKNMTPFPKSQNLIDQRFSEMGAGLLPDYAKSRETDIYPNLKHKSLTAIENAAWLRQQMQGAVENAAGRIYELNPYTNADALVKTLLDIPYNFTLADYGEDVPFMGYGIRASTYDEGFSVNLINRTGLTLVLNPGNLARHFFLHNFEVALQITQTVMIAPQDESNFMLICTAPLPPGARLVFQLDIERLVIG